MALPRSWDDGNSSTKLVIQSQEIQIRIQEFKPNPNAEPFETHSALKESDFILPDGFLKCSAVPTWLINKIYLAKEAGNILYYTVCDPSRTAPPGPLGKIYGNGNLRNHHAFSLHLPCCINEMTVCCLITWRQMYLLVFVPALKWEKLHSGKESSMQIHKRQLVEVENYISRN